MSTLIAEFTWEAAELVRRRAPVGRPACAIILGSGLGGLARRVERATTIPYREIPGFAESTVEGHAGHLIHGWLAGREVVAFSGRFHLYEGHGAATATLTVRVAAALGTPLLVLSNAAGGVRRTLEPGTLMVIADHLNLTWQNPLVGPLVAGDQRFPDMSEPYDAALRRELHRVAKSQGTRLEDGVYLGLLGPTYETPAEVRMIASLGADAVGMSTVAEVIVARTLGLRVLGVSCITNVAAGLSPEPISHADVIAATARASAAFEDLIEGWLAGRTFADELSLPPGAA
jgi:purine-nucleoside phosphorylase